MSTFRYKLIWLPLLLSACANVPHAANKTEASPANAHPGVASPAPAAAEPPLPNVALDDRMLFEFLLGDIAAQRGRPEVAVQAYLELARTTRDPRVARRAAQLAFESHRFDVSLEAFQLWQELEPDAPLARQMLVSLLLSGGRLQEARPHVEKLLAAGTESAVSVFKMLATMLVRMPDHKVAQDWLVDVARPYGALPESHWAIAQVAAAAGKQELALSEIRVARKSRPEWDSAAVLEAQLLMAPQPQQALELLRQYLQSYPVKKDVRLFYARALLEKKQYAESREQFQKLLEASPDNVEIAFAVALLSLQLGELDRAQKELQDTLQKGKKDADTVHYYLGQLNEAKKDDAAALAQYGDVNAGEYAYAARLREAYLLNRVGKLEQARAALKKAVATNNQQRAMLAMIEAQMLRDAGRFADSYRVLQDALAQLPNNPQLLFEQAMMADKLGKTDEFEQTLRKLLQVSPDNAQAYNALGYSFLERNIRIDEGMKLVEKAYALAPDDSAITDSMGWGYYRLGKLDKSAEFLRRAYNGNPDPEIAAHLGEVLWVKGDKQEASKVWQDALKMHPDSEPLRTTIKKFTP